MSASCSTTQKEVYRITEAKKLNKHKWTQSSSLNSQNWNIPRAWHGSRESTDSRKEMVCMYVLHINRYALYELAEQNWRPSANYRLQTGKQQTCNCFSSLPHHLDLPAICSCLGQIPLDDVDKQSSSSGVTWMPTSTGLDAFLSSLGEGEGGLSTAFSRQRVPLHCFRLCSIKIRMSPNGKFIWHWPQVRRSWSPSGAPNVPWSGSSSVRMASRGSATVGGDKKGQLLISQRARREENFNISEKEGRMGVGVLYPCTK